MQILKKIHAVAQMRVSLLEIKFFFFKNTVKKYSNSCKRFTIFINFNKLYLSKQQHLC